MLCFYITDISKINFPYIKYRSWWLCLFNIATIDHLHRFSSKATQLTDWFHMFFFFVIYANGSHVSGSTLWELSFRSITPNICSTQRIKIPAVQSPCVYWPLSHIGDELSYWSINWPIWEFVHRFSGECVFQTLRLFTSVWRSARRTN